MDKHFSVLVMNQLQVDTVSHLVLQVYLGPTGKKQLHHINVTTITGQHEGSMAILTGQSDKLALSHGSRQLEGSKILIHATVKRTIIPQTSTCVHFVTEATLQLGAQALFMKAMPPVLLTSDKLMSCLTLFCRSTLAPLERSCCTMSV